MDYVPKETHVVSVMIDQHKETSAVVRDEQDDRLLLHQIRRQRPTVKATEMKALTKEVRFCADKKIEKNRHVNFGIFPVCQNCRSESDAQKAINADFDMLRQRNSPAKSQKKSGEKGSVALLKVSIQLGCVSRGS